VIGAIWEFCNGFINIFLIVEVPKLREYLLTSGIFTNENTILRDDFGNFMSHYDTFKELVIKGNPPRHSIYVESCPLNTELMVAINTGTYDVRILSERSSKIKYLSIDYKSEIINPIDTVTILKHKHGDLPILSDIQSQRNVKSARN
jgi:hypothetical protein